MVVPFIAFSTFFTLIFFIIKSTNKTRENQYKSLIESLKTETQLKIDQTKSETMTIGLKNRNFLFSQCDLFLTKNAIIVLGYTKNSIFKELSLPIILTSEINEFTSRFPFAYVKKVNKIVFETKKIKINFGEIGFTKTEVELIFNSLNEIEIAKIKQLSEENCW